MAAAAVLEPEIHVLLEFLELILKLLVFELHLLDLPGHLPDLILEPFDADDQAGVGAAAGCIRRITAAIALRITTTDIIRRHAVVLREAERSRAQDHRASECQSRHTGVQSSHAKNPNCLNTSYGTVRPKLGF